MPCDMIPIRPVHLSHIVVSAIWGGVITAITYLEVVHISPFTQLDMFWLVLQNAGIALFNGYALGKIKVSPEGLEGEAQKG